MATDDVFSQQCFPPCVEVDATLNRQLVSLEVVSCGVAEGGVMCPLLTVVHVSALAYGYGSLVENVSLNPIATLRGGMQRFHIPDQLVLHLEVTTEREKERRLRSREFMTCFSCGEVGHYRSECNTWKTRMCWHLSTCAKRRDYQVCPFAHGVSELRTPGLT